MNTLTLTTTCNTAQLPSMPQHMSVYFDDIGKPVFMRVIAVAVAAVRGVFSLK